MSYIDLNFKNCRKLIFYHALIGFLFGRGGLYSQTILSSFNLIFLSSFAFKLEDLFNVGSSFFRVFLLVFIKLSIFSLFFYPRQND